MFDKLTMDNQKIRKFLNWFFKRFPFLLRINRHLADWFDLWIDDEFYGWLCVCGNWEESEFHCSFCGYEPPWGCDCGMHDEEDYYDADLDFGQEYGP